MKQDLYARLGQQLQDTKDQGLFKQERIITTEQQTDIKVSSGEQVLNFCANNYLGLANHPALIEAVEKNGCYWEWEHPGAICLAC